MIIYKLISPSGKIYIGQTKSDLDKRFIQHINSWKRWTTNKSKKGVCTKLFYGFDTYDPETWSKEIIYETDSKEELDTKEIYFIELFDSIQNGYNITKGGNGRKVDFLEEDHKQNISDSRKEYFDTEEGKEWKEELSKKYSGENNPMYGRGKEISKQNSKWYLILDKEDREFIIKNLHQFKIENHCGRITIFPNDYKSEYSKPCNYRAVILKNYNELLPKDEKQDIIIEARKHIKSIKKWEIISPTGKIYITNSLKKFCESRHNLIPQCLGAVSKGKTLSYKGWKCKLIS